MSDETWIIRGGTCLMGGRPAVQDIAIADGTIAGDVGNARIFDASDLIVAPGIVDLHGDGFERNLSPRPGVMFDVDTALIETDRQLIANGITTAYLAMTVSWEPGIRSVDQAREIVAAVQRLRPMLKADIRLQFRWEIFALDAADQMEAWLRLEPKPMLAFNDHFTGLLNGGREAKKIGEHAQRAGMTMDAYLALNARVAERSDEVPGAVARLAAAAGALGVPCLSHDEDGPEVREANRALGISICEFPLTRPTAEAAIGAGEVVILGAPNVLRGGSHKGAINAEPAVSDGLCSALASDYYYPAPLGAVARMSDGSIERMASLWPLVSDNPAAAGSNGPVGLATGAPADVLVLRMDGKRPMVEAVFRGGRLVHASAAGRFSG